MPLAIAFEHGFEHPAVAMVIGKLRVLRLVFRHIGEPREKIRIGPISPRGRTLGIVIQTLPPFTFGRILLLLGPEELAVAFIVPHVVPEIRVNKSVGLVHMAHHALTRRNRAGESMLDRMAGFASTLFIISEHAIAGCAFAEMAELGV